MTIAVNLSIDEAALTGESAAVDKSPVRLDSADLALGDRRNMVYAGTLVTRGRGQAVVVATGMSTEFGRISRLVQRSKPDARRCRRTWIASSLFSERLPS